ncbi:MAG: hypothetical protein ABI758_01715 [Candidatus Woesebacteria bacterium]
MNTESNKQRIAFAKCSVDQQQAIIDHIVSLPQEEKPRPLDFGCVFIINNMFVYIPKNKEKECIHLGDLPASYILATSVHDSLDSGSYDW